MATQGKWILVIFLAMVALFCFLSYGNPQFSKYVYLWQTYILQENVTYQGENPVLDRSHDFTGTWREWYASGALSTEAEYKDGVPNGIFKSWNEDGSLSMQWNMVNGQLHGQSFTFYKNGQKEKCIEYNMGKEDGMALYWSKDGQLQYVQKYKNDLPIGIANYFTNRGKLKKIEYWDGKTEFDNIPSKIIYDPSKSIDLRPQYAKEIAEFEAELAKFEAEHGIK